MPKCAIKTCPSRVGRNSPYYSYFFPKQDKSPDRYASWCKHAEHRYLNKSSKVCAIHFKLDDFDESDIMKIRLTPGLFKNKTPKLKKGVVPSLYMDNNGYEEGCKDGVMLLPYVQIRDVQDILNGVPSMVCVQDELEDSQPSTSWLYPACEMNADKEKYSETEVAIQCEFGVEVYREFDARREVVDK